ncbi:ornithine cyclodeaminase [Caballeronia sordidicola]|uniref:Ornithine cyclodeaminase n=1 Tax=Caballeronia sordidicola TaxID=196367 RepID=A0A158GFL2_CABSO|nr:ornithine cyclodeaminase family protein [Caballeronia sordidicola]SAL30180.1 ornithine cyclodeaminase [Caballeronia sordidicola]
MALYFSETDVRHVLTMQVALQEVEQAFAARGRGVAFDVPRERARLPGAHLHIMQAAAPELDLVGYKAYYIKPGAGRVSLIHLISRSSGELQSIVEADWLGQMRTGATTGVAARHLARSEAGVLGLFGYGRHAVTQLEAISLACCLREVRVFGRDGERVEAFCREQRERLQLDVRPAASREDAVYGADVIALMTRSSEPLFDGAWLETGQLVTAAGSNSLDRREVDLETVARADLIVVDSREVAERECGDLLPAYEAGIVHWESITDLGQVVAGVRPGRRDDAQIILFESHGMALQDIYTASKVVELARAQGLGTPLPIA